MVNSERIKIEMREQGIKQKDVAKVWKCALPTVSQKINNIRPMLLREAEDLAKFLNIPDERFGIYFFA